MVFFEILVVIILIFANGLLAMAETAVLSVRSAKLIMLEREGKRGARRVLDLVEDPTGFLATVQVLMSAVSISAGIYSGATMSEELAIFLEPVPYIGVYSYYLSFLTVLFGVTYFSVVFGELVPKRVAIAFPERVALSLVPALWLVERALKPLILFLNFSTDLFVKNVDSVGEDESEVTEEEIKIVVSQGAEIVAIEKEEEQIVHKALRLGDRPVNSFMSPRTDVFWLDLAEPVDVNWTKVCESNHTNFPLAYRNVDDLRGLLSVNDFGRALLEDPHPSLELYAHEVLKVPPSTTALDLIRLFRAHCTSFAVIVDEHGGVDGVVTIHDLTELLVGEFDTNEEEPSIRLRDDGSYAVDAYVDILDIGRLLNWTSEILEEERDYTSLAGMLLDKLGRVPHEGDLLVFGRHEFEVIDMDGHRIDKVIIRKRRE